MKISDVKAVNSDFKLNINKVNPPSVLTQDHRVNVLFIAVNKINPYKYQPRVLFDEDEIISLAETIDLYGIRQPLTVIRKEDGEYEVVSGERRLRAAKFLGLPNVPCIVLENDGHAHALSLIENIQRKDLHPIELLNSIEGYQKLNSHLTIEDLYKKLGISKSHFYKLASLANLNDAAREFALQHQLPINTLYEISRMAPDKQLNALKNSLVKDAQLPAQIGKTRTKVIELYMKDGMMCKNVNLSAIPNRNKDQTIAILRELINGLEHAE